jgi:hypothetical protein
LGHQILAHGPIAIGSSRSCTWVNFSYVLRRGLVKVLKRSGPSICGGCVAEIQSHRHFRTGRLKDQELWSRCITNSRFVKFRYSRSRRIEADLSRRSRKEVRLRKFGFQSFGTQEVELHGQRNSQNPEEKNVERWVPGISQRTRAVEVKGVVEVSGKSPKGHFSISGTGGYKGQESGLLTHEIPKGS